VGVPAPSPRLENGAPTHANPSLTHRFGSHQFHTGRRPTPLHETVQPLDPPTYAPPRFLFLTSSTPAVGRPPAKAVLVRRGP
jgi:hypothetical protein